MSFCPAMCSAALAVPGPWPSSMTAVTVMLVAADLGDQVVGAVTLFTTGPTWTHFALWHNCPGPHFGLQGSVQRLLMQVAGVIHWLLSVQGPSTDTEQAASAAKAIQAAKSLLIGGSPRTRIR